MIRHRFIKSILNGYECNDTERKVFILHVKRGGLSIYNPSERFQTEFENSRLAAHIMVKKRGQNQDKIYDKSIEKSQQKHHAEIKKQKSQRNCENFGEVKSLINGRITRRALEASIEVSVSSWLTTLPIKNYGFCMEKQLFWDSLYIRYNVLLKRIASFCACGATFKLEHAPSIMRIYVNQA